MSAKELAQFNHDIMKTSSRVGLARFLALVTSPIFRRAWKMELLEQLGSRPFDIDWPDPPVLHGGLEDLFDTSLAPTPRASTPSDPARLPSRTQGNLSTTSRSSAPEAAGIRRLSSSWCSSNDEPGGLPSLCGQ